MASGKKYLSRLTNAVALAAMTLTTSCAFVDAPSSRNVQIPSPTTADARTKAMNERPDSVMYVPLGEDILVPEISDGESFPTEMVGPYELRGETLAGALQLVLADYDISLAFESQAGLTRRVTVANLRGDLGKVVHQLCSLANLYCSYEDGTVTVKDTQTFTVTLPPIGRSTNTGSSSSSGSSSGSSSSGDEDEFLDDVAEGLGAILGEGTATPIVDPTTRTIIYSATQRTADIASRYFQRLRANTAMIVFETYIWEVSLNSGNSTGVDWFKLASFGKFNTGISINGGVGADFTNPISIGLPTTGDEFTGTGDILEFLSQFGAVKTISQPQVTVLSGSEAELRVADTRNYVSQVATTLTENQSTTSVNTDSVDTGFTLNIASSWDKSTVYANINVELTDVKQIDDYAFSDGGGGDGSTTRIQLPQTSERQLSTQIRVRPGDSVLIAGLVRENDNFNEEGVGFMQPLIPHSRTAQTNNLELVILLRPRVVVYTAANDRRYVDYTAKKHHTAATPESSNKVSSPEYKNVSTPVVDPIQEQIPDGVAAPLSSQPITKEILTTSPVVAEPIVTPPPAAPVVTKAPVAPPVSTPPAMIPARTSAATDAPTPILKPTAQDSADISSSSSRMEGGFGSSPSGSVYPAPPPSSELTPAAPPTESTPVYPRPAVPLNEGRSIYEN